jgi:hypothetical protein
MFRKFLSTASYKQGGGDTIIQSGGTISAMTFKATGSLTPQARLNYLANQYCASPEFRSAFTMNNNTTSGTLLHVLWMTKLQFTTHTSVQSSQGT